MSGHPRGGDERDVVEVFQAQGRAGTPLTTTEVAAALERPRRTVYAQLNRLAAGDILETKKVGARARVWWVPVAAGQSLRDGWTLDEHFDERAPDLFARICDATPIGIAVFDASGSIVFANERLAELVDTPVENILGGRADDRVWNIVDERGEPLSEADDPVVRVLRTGEPVVGFRHRFTGPDGTRRWLSSNAAPILAANGTAEGVVVGMEDVSELVDRERRTRAQQTELLRLDRVNSVIRGVAGAMTTATTRDEIERATCELIARSEPYLFAVFGEFSPSYTEFLPRTSAGVGEAYLEAILNASDAPPLDEGPGATAAKTGEVQVVQQISDLAFEQWHDAAETSQFRSFASVPVVHEDVVYGVLGVYAQEPDAFDEREQEVLAELGEMVGYALHAAEATEELRAEQVVELTFRSDALARPFVDRGVDSLQATGDGAVGLDDGTYLQYFTVRNCLPGIAVASLEALGIGSTRLLSSTADAFELEVQTKAESFVSVIASVDGTVRSVSLRDGTAEVVADVPRTVDRRGVIDRLRALSSDVRLVSERLHLTMQTLQQPVKARLTDRQFTALRLAYLAGYFEQPRQSTGEDIADRMDITTTTFHRHLRNAEQQIMTEIFSTSWDETNRK